MKYYTIYPSENVDRDFSFDLKGKQEIIIDYFKFDLINNFSKNQKINFSFYDDFENQINEILETDFYYSSSGILLFSKKFYDKMSDILKNDCLFYKCYIKNREADVYALYIKNKTNFLDENSNFDQNFRKEDFYIIRDSNFPYIYIVSQIFINAVKN